MLNEVYANEYVKPVGDVLAIGTVASVAFQWAPIVLALPAALYSLIRIYETKTVQDMLERWSKRRG